MEFIITISKLHAQHDSFCLPRTIPEQYLCSAAFSDIRLQISGSDRVKKLKNTKNIAFPRSVRSDQDIYAVKRKRSIRNRAKSRNPYS